MQKKNKYECFDALDKKGVVSVLKKKRNKNFIV